MSDEATRQERARAWFEALRDEICAAFEAIEDEAETAGDCPGRFARKAWERPGGGGGVMAIMRGRVFEKVGVNVSTVHGTFSETFRQKVKRRGGGRLLLGERTSRSWPTCARRWCRRCT